MSGVVACLQIFNYFYCVVGMGFLALMLRTLTERLGNRERNHRRWWVA
jgi:hypothetical protein